LSEALRREVALLGIRVLIVEPGAFRTEFAGRSLRGSASGISDYDATTGARRKGVDRTHGTQPGDPHRAAQVIIDILGRKVLPERLLLGSDAVNIVGPELARQLEEIEAWADDSRRTDFMSESRRS